MMKKILGVVVCVCILLGMVGCAPKGDSFASEQELLTFIEGIWKNDERYVLIKDGEMYSFDESDIEEAMQDSFDSAMVKDTSIYSKWVEEDSFQYINEVNISSSDLLSDGEIGEIKFKKGRFETEDYMWIIEGQTLTPVEGGENYQKISDAPEITKELFPNVFEKAKENYKPKLAHFKPTPKKYAEIIKNLHSDFIDKLVLTDGKENEVLYTDDGRYGNTIYYTDKGMYEGAIIHDVWRYSDSEFEFIDNYFGTKREYKVQYNTSSDVILVENSSHKYNLEIGVRDALVWFNGYPNVLTAEELLKLFNENAELDKNNYKNFRHTENGITYQITITPDNWCESFEVRIEF